MIKKKAFDKAFILEVIKLFRPKFHNRVALVILAFGFGLIGNSYLFQILSQVLEIQFSIRITDENDPYLGMALVVLALVYNTIINIIEYKMVRRVDEIAQREVERDRVKFSESQLLFSEDAFKVLKYNLVNNDQYYRSEINNLANWLEYFSKESNCYVTNELELVKKDTIDAFRKLRSFLALNFFVYGNATENEMRYCLHPSLNDERGGTWSQANAERYDNYQDQLIILTKEAEIQYNKYLKTAAKLLLV